MLNKTSFYFLFLLLIVFSCSASNEAHEETVVTSEDEKEATVEEANLVTDSIFIVLNTFNELDSIFDEYHYSLENVRNSKKVPRLFVHEVKKSLREESANTRQFDFIRMILSNALKVNENILAERERVLDFDRVHATPEDNPELQEMMKKYRAESIEDLKERVNVIPPSLILCQSIMESGWGKSHFAYEGNALFGEHAKAGSPNSIKAKGANIGLHTFPSIYFAIESYALNLNRNHAYHSLRTARTKLVQAGKEINGLALANTQDHYSEKGHEYAEHLKRVISLYHLGDFDDCTLLNETTKIIVIRS